MLSLIYEPEKDPELLYVKGLQLFTTYFEVERALLLAVRMVVCESFGVRMVKIYNCLFYRAKKLLVSSSNVVPLRKGF